MNRFLAPHRIERLRVVAHEVDTDADVPRYILDFTGGSGAIAGCQVTQEAYQAVSDGAFVEVRSSTISKLCIGINAGERVIKAPTPIRANELWSALLLIIFALAPRSFGRKRNQAAGSAC